MAFRIDIDRPAGEEARRIAREQTGAAVAALDTCIRDPSDAPGIHEVRKRLKKLRALARLIREPLGTKAFNEANTRFREAGKLLSEQRDADVLAQAVERVAPDEAHAALIDPIRREISAWQDARTADDARIDVLRRAMALLEQSTRRIDSWQLPDDGMDLVGPGLLRSYADGRRAFRAVAAGADPAAFHDWRKRAKDHWYHVRLLREVWPPVMKATASSAGRLADVLGEAQDLSMLLDTLREGRGTEWNVQGADQLMALAEERRTQLWQEARPLGMRLWAEAPKRFARRLESYWLAARTSAASAEVPSPP